MRFVDVCGPPGSGKSTLADPIWGPHELPISSRLPPAEWHDFLNEITRLFHLIQPHPTFPAAIRMNNRSIRKMSTVVRSTSGVKPGPYIQTGLVQRGLGFGWRMNDMGIDLNELRHYFRLMPTSVGVAVTKCDPEVVKQRNHDRLKVQATAHENRDFMVPLMQPAISIAIEVLSERGVRVIEIDTERPIEEARQSLIDFAGSETDNDPPSRLSCQVEVLSPPPWWG